ncbi:MAG: prephenate dehydrogenase/arogenate dehydrogenase family protein [Candidatus Thioglobus sp.]
MNKICVIGVGLIGGSFVRGLKKANAVDFVCGFGKTEDSLRRAKDLGVIDAYTFDISEAVEGADMVIIATPVDSIEEVLSLIKPYVSESTIISDVGSTKLSVINSAISVFGELPARFIPAHPIAGKERSGVESSDANLFNNKRVILTPQENSDSDALESVTNLWQSLGAKVETMSAKQHDDLLAMTSHLPHMLAFGLMDYLINNNPNAIDYAAGGFKDFSRIASGDSVMWRDICLNNAEEITKHIEDYQKTLNKLSTLIGEHKSEEIERLFNEAKLARDSWLSKRH